MVADLVAGEIRDALRTAASTASSPTGPASPPSQEQAVGGPMDADLPSRLMAALKTLGLRGIARPTPNRLHLIAGPNAPAILAGLRSLIGA